MNEWEEYQKMLSGKKTGASEWEEYQSMLSGGKEQAFERGDIPTTTTKPAPPQPAPTATPEKLDFQAWRYQDMQAPTIREATADVIPQNQTSRDMKLSVAPTPDKERRMPAFNNTGEPIVQGSLDRAPEGTRIQNTESPYWNLPAHQQKLVDMVMTGRDDIETKRVKVKKNFGFDPYTQPPYNLEGTGAGMTAAFIENMFSRVGTLPPAENANEMAVMGAGLAGSVVPGALVAGATGPLGNVAQGVVTGAGTNLAATPGNADRETIVKQILLGGLLGGFGGGAMEGKPKVKPVETTAGPSINLGPKTQVSAPRMSPNVEQTPMQVRMNKGVTATKQPWEMTRDEAQRLINEAEPVQKISDKIDARDGYVYRAVTGPEYEDAIRTGVLKPGSSADTGGTVNFSKEPIPLYAGSAYGQHGIIVEIPIESIGKKTTYPGSKDLFLASEESVPLSSASRTWAIQFGDKRGVRIVDYPDLAKKYGVSEIDPTVPKTEATPPVTKGGDVQRKVGTLRGTDSGETITDNSLMGNRVGETTPIAEYQFKVGDKTDVGYIRAQVTSTDGRIGYIISDKPEGIARAISQDDLIRSIDIEQKNRVFDAKQVEQARIASEAKAKRDDLKGFTDSMDPMARGRSTSLLLNQEIRHRGKVMRRKEFVETLSDEGYVGAERKGKYIAQSPDGSFFDVRKVDYDYLNHINKAKPPTPSSVKTPVGKEIVPETPATVPDVPDNVPPSMPPPVKKAATVADDAETIGLKKAEIARIRDAAELDRLPKTQRITFEETLSRASDENVASRADEVANRVLAGGEMSDTEYAGMTIRAAQLANESDDILNDIIRLQEEGNDVALKQARQRLENVTQQMDVITRASDMAGTEQGRALNLRKLMVNLEDYSLAKVTNRARERKGAALTPDETARIEKVVSERNDLQTKLDEALRRNEELTVKQEEIIAQRVAQAEATRANIRKKAAGSREAIKADRDNIKKQLEAIGYRVNDITGVTTEGAYLIGKLAISYVREGVTNISEVVKLVKNDLPDLSDYDIYKAINTRDPKIQAKMATEAEKRVRSIKSQAKILADIEDASKGVFGEIQAKPPVEAVIRNLRDKLAALKREAASPTLDKTKIARVRALIAETRKQISEQYRAVRKAKTKASPELQQSRDILRYLRKERNTQDVLATLEEKIRNAEKGEFTRTKRRTPSPEKIEALRRQLNKLRRDAYSSGIHPDRLERALRTISSLQDRIVRHYSPLTRRLRPTITSELKAMQEQIADLKKHLRIDDELADLNEQIRTGEFKVPQKKVRRPEPPEITKLRMERDRLRNKIEAELELLAPMTGKRVFGETVNTLRTLKATADLSATLRQGLVLSSTRPLVAFNAFGKAVKAMFSKHTAEQIDYAIKNRETAYLGDRAGLYLAGLADTRLTSHEEAFMARFVEKVPVLGSIVRGSERAMVTQLNILRASAFDEFIRVNPNATATELKAWANFVNVASGRGDLGKLAGAADYLSTVFFAPRFAASRFQTPYMFLKYAKEPRVRRAIAKDLVATMGLGTAVLTLAGMAGAEISGDPRDPDFGKIKIGPTRIDIWAGFQQPARFMARIGTAATDRSGLTGGSLSRSKKEYSLIENAMRFAAFKLAPTITLPNDLLSGKTVVGEKIGAVDALANSVMPMMYEDIFDAYRQQGAGMAALTTGLNLVGVSTNTYQKKK